MKKPWELSAAQELCVRFSQNPLPQDHQKSSMSGERSRGEMKVGCIGWVRGLSSQRNGLITDATILKMRSQYVRAAEGPARFAKKIQTF